MNYFATVFHRHVWSHGPAGLSNVVLVCHMMSMLVTGFPLLLRLRLRGFCPVAMVECARLIYERHQGIWFIFMMCNVLVNFCCCTLFMTNMTSMYAVLSKQEHSAESLQFFLNVFCTRAIIMACIFFLDFKIINTVTIFRQVPILLVHLFCI